MVYLQGRVRFLLKGLGHFTQGEWISLEAGEVEKEDSLLSGELVGSGIKRLTRAGPTPKVISLNTLLGYCG